MENFKFDELPQLSETLFSGISSSKIIPEIDPSSVMEQKPLNEGFKDSQMNESQDISGDFMVCDSSSRLVTSGFSRLCCTEDIVTFVNSGCEASRQTELGLEFSADVHYQGGHAERTDECISDGGDYPFLYQSARLGNCSYQFTNLPPGEYFVDLHFAEIIYTFGPRGMRVFNVMIQDEKALSDFDIFSVVGANKPVQLVDYRVTVKEDGMMVIRFEGVQGSPVVSGICIRKAPKSAVSQVTQESFRCQNCAAEIEVPLAQEKGTRLKAMAKYEKKIEELSEQCQRKTDECYQAWMSLTVANEELSKVRLELETTSFQTVSLDQTVKNQAEKLKAVSDRYEHDKKLWMMAISGLEEKIKNMKKEHAQLAHDAHECADSIPDLSKMVSGVQMLVAQCEEFKQKYIEEQKKRKKLFNEVQEAKGNIRVFCRCRPLSKKEQLAGYTTAVDFDGAKDGELAILMGGSNKKMFKFDRVYTPKDDQVDVFMDACPMATSVLDGYNVCIFAYGQTGTGKTFTMEGTEQNRGVNYRTLEQLFKISQERRDTFTYDISVSVLEVYNEQIRDLLDTSTSKKLEIKQASEGSHHVPGIVEAKVETIKQVWEVLRNGSNARAVGSNNVNEHSSRSHCMLCIMVKSKNIINGECTKSKLWLVDLAGSERLAKTEVHGDRLKEAQNINRSLSALGDVISALANKSSHIPYRNSKLTHLLQDSLGGDSKTLMFVQISPSEHDVGETLSSLNFASRVRGVELAPARRQVDTSELQKTKILLDKARQESKAKEESIRKLEETLVSFENKARCKDQTYKNHQEKIRDLEEQLGLKAASHSHSEKQLLQLQERLKGREETCAALQLKIKELEDKLREQQQHDSASLQKVRRDLEQKLKEQVRESELHSLTLQQKIKELEQKIEHERKTDSLLLQQKVKDLQEKLKEQERQLEQRILQPLDNAAEVAGATPIVGGRPSLRDETMIEVDPFILRSSNSSNRMSHGSTYSRKSEVIIETRRKRGFRSGETENQMPAPAALHEKKIRKSDPPKPFLTKSKRPVAPPQRLSGQSRVTKEKDIKKKWC